jgi:hypothetical protein
MEPEGSVTLKAISALGVLPDLDLEDLIPSRSYEEIQGPSIRTEALRPVADAFIRNMKRVDQMAQMPMAIACIAATLEKDGEFKVPLARSQPVTIPFKEYPDLNNLGSYLRPTKCLTIDNIKWLSPFMNDPERLKLELYGAISLVRFLMFQGLGLSVNAWLSSLIVGAWTAFETLAGDLWEEAINAHPKTLATRASQLRAGEQKPSISFDRLGKFGFNLAGIMGTLLRESRNNPFQTLEQIAETYQYTFPNGPHVSRKEFWKDKDIFAVSLLRNVIAHRAGVADHKFIGKAESDARLAHFKEDAEIQLDGALVSELLTGLFAFAKKAIHSVDGWIAAN